MNWADWIIVALLALSCVIGVVRGLVREVMSLLCWLAAMVVAVSFHGSLAALLSDTFASPSIRHVVAFGGLFIATLLVGSLISYLMTALVRATGLTGTDRVLGALFGLARGGLIVLLLVYWLPKALPVESDVWWRESSLIPVFVAAEDQALSVWAELSAWAKSLFGI